MAMAQPTNTESSPTREAALSPYAGEPDRPVFVGACPRSGTTLLRAMLNHHPELAIPRESRFVLEAWRRRTDFGDLRERRNRRQLARWIFRRKTARPGRFGVRPRKGVRRLVAAPPTIGSVLGTCFALYAENQRKPRWGDKRPLYIRHLDAVFAMFPDAQFLTMVRDPRAIVASIRKLGWYDVPTSIAIWQAAIAATERWKQRLAPDQLLQIRYEDLVDDPEVVLGRVTQFLGLDPAGIGSMLSFHTETDVPQNKYHWRVSQPVTTDAIRSWEKSLNPEEVALVEYATAGAMARLGYEPVAEGIHVPASLKRAYHRARWDRTVKRYRWEIGELYRRTIYRAPVAARLTAGQQRVHR